MKKAIVSVACIVACIGIHAQLGMGDLSGLKRNPNAKAEVPKGSGFSTKLPSSYSLKQFTPYPKSQGHYGTCVSWATSYCAMTTQYAIANYITNRNIITAMAFCPFFTHNNATPKLNDLCDGQYFETVGDELLNKGAKRFYLPQIICETPNNDYMINGAKNYKISAYKFNYFASDGLTYTENHEGNLKEFFTKKKLFDVEQVKLLLNLNFVPDISIWSPPSFSTNGPLWELSAEERSNPVKAMMDQMNANGWKTPYGGHRIAIVSYDDNKYGGAFEIMNSWGSTYGEGGYVWVKYSDLQQFTTEIGWIEVNVTPTGNSGCVYGDCNNGYGIKKGGGEMYEGFFKDGKFDGYGIYVWPNGASYSGEWKNGQRIGDAVCYYADGTYGGVKYAADTLQSGFCSVTYVNGNAYQGYFNSKGKFEGYGTFKFASGLVYKGQFANGYNTGLGQFKFADGSTYIGYVTNGTYDGLGMEISATGLIKAGTWTNGKLTSGMKYGFASNATPVNIGGDGANVNYLDANCTSGDCLTGKGIRKFGGGAYYEGEFEDGVEHGWGKKVFPNGEIDEGYWELGSLNGPTIIKLGDGTTALGCFNKGAFDGYWLIKDAASNVVVRLFSNGTIIKTLSGQSFADFASQKLELPMHSTSVKLSTNTLMK